MKRLPEEDLQHILNNTTDLWDELRNKTIFITGGTGFFGKWLLESFLYAIKKNHCSIRLYVLSRNPDAFKVRYPHLGDNPNFTFLKGDIANFEFPELEIDYIIHAATEASARLNYEQPLVMIDSIVKGTRNVLGFARQRNVKRMLYISSGAVYGVQPENLTNFSETYMGAPNPLQTSSAYAESKRIAELLCVCHSKLYNIEIPIARCFAFTGPYLNLDAHFAIGNFIRNGLNHENIIIKGDGQPKRSYLYAADLVIWLLHIMLRGRSGEAYNVGSDEAISIKDLVLKVASFFPGLKVEVLNQINPTDRNQNYIPNVSKFRKEFNFVQTIGLDDAILKTISFYQTLMKG